MEWLTKRERQEARRETRVVAEQSYRRRAQARRIGLWGIALAALVGGIVLMVKFANQPGSGGVIVNAHDVTAQDWVLGPTTAPVTLIEYSDFQCPACSAQEPNLRRLHKDFPTDLRIVYRYFPLYRIHQNANLASYAAEAAGRQGKFWAMHDKIFEGQRSWAEDRNARGTFIVYARQLGLSLDQFTADLESNEVHNRVQADLTSGEQIGINGTPTFFINGRQIDNPRIYEQFADLIRSAKTSQ